MKNKILNAIGVLLIGIALSCAHLLGPDDIAAEAATSATLAELQAADPGSARQLAAGQAQCEASLGANAVSLWTVDGDLVCRTSAVIVQVEQP